MNAKLLLPVAAALALLVCDSGQARVIESTRPTAGVLVYENNGSVWRADIHGRHRILLAKGATQPTVSPSGRWVAYDSGGNMHLVPVAGGKPKIFHHYDGYPTWAPDSRHIGIAAGVAGTIIVDVRTGHETTIPSYGVNSISFSPDSTRVVEGVESPDGGDLYVGSIAGGPAVRITYNRESFDPVWGPKGIAFLRDYHGPAGDIWMTGPRRNDARRLTHNRAGLGPVSFSADGTKLLAGADLGLWAVDGRSGRARAIKFGNDATGLSLSRNGRTVLALVGCGGDAAGPHHGVIETLPFAGGKPHIVARGPCGANWNAGS